MEESKELVVTEQGEMVKRGPIGQKSTLISPMGYFVEMGEDGMPIFKGKT